MYCKASISGFLVRPWYKNVSRSLRKEPKWFLRDWASIEDPGDKAETFVACHLLKAVDGWNDMGLGDFELGYLRDKEKREVDFLVARDGKPWFLVEVKQRDEKIGQGPRVLSAPARSSVCLSSRARCGVRGLRIALLSLEGPWSFRQRRSYLSSSRASCRRLGGSSQRDHRKRLIAFGARAQWHATRGRGHTHGQSRRSLRIHTR